MSGCNHSPLTPTPQCLMLKAVLLASEWVLDSQVFQSFA